MNHNSTSPATISVNALVFSGGEGWGEDDTGRDPDVVLQAVDPSAPGPSSVHLNQQKVPDRERNVSTYVRIFEDMLGTVITEEPHLFNDEEVEFFATFAQLSQNARFLMVKLLLRKQDTWHRLDTLKYQDELGSVSAIIDAIDELCPVGPESLNDLEEEEMIEEREVIDLTMDNDPDTFTVTTPVEAGASETSSECRTLVLARSEREMDLETLLDCLRTDELKKEELIKTLLRTSSSQTTLLSFARRNDGAKPKGSCHHQTKLPFSKRSLQTQQERLKEIALRSLVKCIKVDQEFVNIIQRVNLVYFRLAQHTPDLLLPALLSGFKKRTYTAYKYERTKHIWPTRQALLDYEDALILAGQVDALLGGNVPALAGQAGGSKTPAAVPLPTPVTPGSAKGKGKATNLDDDEVEPKVKPDTARVRGARRVTEIFEHVYPRWQELVRIKGEEDGRRSGLERFDCGHVLTRIICQCSSALATLGEHERELEVLEALLAQKRWRRGRRGKWHERRALVLTTHFPKHEETTKRALVAVVEALQDPDTHTVYRPKLQRRLKKLEEKLKLPLADRHTCEGQLAVAETVVFEAVRIRRRAASSKLDRTGRNISSIASPQRNQDIKRFYLPVAIQVKQESSSRAVPNTRGKPSTDEQKGKSIWVGRNGEELTVEALALQRYEAQGYKGLHCETRVIAMLFGLLFWDIMFAPIPGAFETPYQTAPLDIAEDSFYHSRKDLMETRLSDIEAGEAANIIRQVDSVHRASGTWCVGVRWDLFSSEDLVDIVTCIGGKALSVICRLLCEDYSSRGSGGPDLFLWNPEMGTCKFVEVKGPGDTLQENQKVWIDVLLRAPTPVELCHVVEEGTEVDKKRNMHTPKNRRGKSKKAAQRNDSRAVESEDETDALPTVPIGPTVAAETAPTEQPIRSVIRSLPDHLIQPTVASPSTSVVAPPTPVERAPGHLNSSPLKRKVEVVITTPPRKRLKV
ncbi:VRR-NUC domain-containing protein [Melanogaster broomeanus]|nr:VRR-NUC domain-containing protein [Melanogaster broomeanus]